jgi:hypothetical protein
MRRRSRPGLPGDLYPGCARSADPTCSGPVSKRSWSTWITTTGPDETGTRHARPGFSTSGAAPDAAEPDRAHRGHDRVMRARPVISASVPVACPIARSKTVCRGHSWIRQIASEQQIAWSGKHDKPVPKLMVRRQDGLDSVLAGASCAVQQLGTATHTPYSHPGQPTTLVSAWPFCCEQVHASSYGSEGWGFESLRARPAQRPVANRQRAFLPLWEPRAHVSPRTAPGSSIPVRPACHLPADARTRPW